MAMLRRNGFKRDMNCYWTTAQNGSGPANVLEGVHHAASSVLYCSNKGSQTAGAVSAGSIRATPPGTSPKTSTGRPARPSIQPLAASGLPQIAPSSTRSQPVSSLRATATNITPSSIRPVETPISPQIASLSTQNQSTTSPISTTTGISQQATQPSSTSESSQAVPSSTHHSKKSTVSGSVQSTKPSKTTHLNPTTQSVSTTSLQSSPSPSTSESYSSSILLAATVPFQPLPASAGPPARQTSVPDEVSGGDAGSELGPEQSSGRSNPHAGGIIGGILALVLILAAILTIFFCRRNKRKQHRRSLGYMSTTPRFKPWKKKEVERRNTIANLEGLLDLDPNNKNVEDGRRPVKPMKYRTVQFPALSYEGKGTTSRPLTMPETNFAPLRANRSSSLYSGSFYNSFPTEQFPPRPRSALLPPSRAGFRGESPNGSRNGQETNPFMTPSELLQQKKIQNSGLDASTLPRSAIYISRPYSVFDIADDDVKEKERDSGISGLSKSNSKNSKSNKSRTLSVSSSASSTAVSKGSNLTSSRSNSDAHSRFSQGSTYATSTISQNPRALVTVRDLDTDVRLSLDEAQEYGYRTNDFGTRVVNIDTKRLGTGLKKDLVLVVESEINVDSDGGSLRSAGRGRGGGGLEEWEEREMERRRKELEKARLYKGRIRPGMGVQKARGGAGALGVQRSFGMGELGVQRTSGEWDD